MTDRQKLMNDLMPAMWDAGAAIMAVYSKDFASSVKSDGSPVTEADQAAEDILLSALNDRAPNIDIVSEENAASHDLTAPARFFLVDALDGTREFLKRDRKGEFTVNVALIEDGLPVMGIVFAPALDRIYYGTAGHGAFLNGNRVSVPAGSASDTIALVSQSHRDADTDAWLNERKITSTRSVGSSLKFAMLATGEAQIYPRLTSIMEWDTAAGDAVLRAAGGSVTTLDGTALRYGKPGYRNIAFIARSANCPQGI